ncbi:hypothetical protein [Desulfolutivibrio sp.]|uniref:hypothetical protein n=1 Tax=Desulfolutivibrio sp. TaxID=2773296 RepID=UPI002F968489
MKTFRSRRALSVLLFGLAWTVFNWPILSLLAADGLAGAFWRLGGWWMLALCGLFFVSREVAPQDAQHAENVAPPAEAETFFPRAPTGKSEG